MKKTDKLTAMAIQSKCTICGKDIGFQLWECNIKDKKHHFVHYNCLGVNRKEKKND